MTTSLRSHAPTALLLAGLVLVAGTSGAVAGSMITGKDIKNGTVTTADLMNGTVTGADVKDRSIAAADVSPQLATGARPVSGYVVVHDSQDVVVGGLGILNVTCPAGTSILGTTAWWTSSYAAVQAEPVVDGGYMTKARTYANNAGASTDTVHLVAYCGRTSAP